MSNFMYQSTTQKMPIIPSWMIWTQAFCFSLLYAIWALPETILIRHICLVIGAVIGCYEIYQFRHALLRKNALAIWLITLLFIWAAIHLFLFSYDFDLQVLEFGSIWKRTLLGFLFALGFGMALSQQSLQKQAQYFVLIYLGLLAPTCIYLIRYSFTHFAPIFGLKILD